MVRRYVDVNVFVYWLCAHPVFGERARYWIEKVEKEGNYITSSLTLHETLIIVAGLVGKNLRDRGFVETVISSITSLKGLKIEPLTKEDFMNVMNIMKEFKLDLEDSLHLTVALRKNAEEIVSNDSDFNKANIKRVF